MPEVTVGDQESVRSIAKRHGFFWETVWNHADNAVLREIRNPNVLRVGDRLFVPERRERLETVATETRHTLRIKGEATKVRVALRRFGKPRANEPYQLEVGGEIIDGTTDAEGVVEANLPPGVKSATLLLASGEERMPLRVARLDPASEICGIKQRLNNLGFACGPENDDVTPRFTSALARFQARNDLPATGESDAKTIALLDDLYR